MMTPANALVVKLTPQALDPGALEMVGEQLAGLMEERGRRHLYLDLGSVKYICSLGLSKLIVLHKKVQRGGGQLTLFNVNDFVFRILEVSRLTGMLDVHRPQADGLAFPLSDALPPSPEPEPTR